MKVFRGIIRAFIAFVIYMIVIVVLPSNLPTPIVIIEIAMFPMSPIIGYFFPDICRTVYKWYKEEKSAYDFSKEQWQSSAPQQSSQSVKIEELPQKQASVNAEVKRENAAGDFNQSIKQWSEFVDKFRAVADGESDACAKTGITESISSALVVVDRMEGHNFEHWCARLLEMNGFENVEVTRGSHDFGADVVCEKDGTKYAVQCKRFDNKVNNSAVQQALSGRDYHKCETPVVMTNNYFAPSAVEQAAASNVLLWDRDTIIQFMKNSGKYTDAPIVDEPIVSEPIAVEQTNSDIPKGQREPTYYEEKAIRRAKEYDDKNYSKSQLIDELVDDGFTKEQAEFAADYIATYWQSSPKSVEISEKPKYSVYQQQAIDKALQLLEWHHYSKSDLINALTKTYGFTFEQAMFAADEIEKM
ncbi:MAG: restriction endonuclease [Oscillospiraceae bacterium]|nr:restriction endonuclease [Oscillospiraceae bacterium]